MDIAVGVFFLNYLAEKGLTKESFVDRGGFCGKRVDKSSRLKQDNNCLHLASESEYATEAGIFLWY